MTDYYNEETRLEEMKEMKKVVKFGGSSLANADQFKKVGAINFPSWSGQPFLSILLYRDGKGLGIKSVTKGTFEPTEITEITRIEDAPQNLYRLHTSGDDIYTYDLDSKELIPE